MDDKELEFLKHAKQYFDGLALYFKSQTKEYNHPEDINPDEFESWVGPVKYYIEKEKAR